MQSKVAAGVSSHTENTACPSASVPRSVTHKLLHAPLPRLCLLAKAFPSGDTSRTEPGQKWSFCGGLLELGLSVRSGFSKGLCSSYPINLHANVN